MTIQQDHADRFGGLADTAATHTSKTIVVYVCPTPDCRNYYGSSDMGDLSSVFTGPKTENKHALQQATGSTAHHSRAACPFCKTRGNQVERVPMTLKIAVPVVGPPTPELPPYH